MYYYHYDYYYICFFYYLSFNFRCDFLDLPLGIVCTDLKLLFYIFQSILLFLLGLLQSRSVKQKKKSNSSTDN